LGAKLSFPRWNLWCATHAHFVVYEQLVDRFPCGWSNRASVSPNWQSRLLLKGADRKKQLAVADDPLAGGETCTRDQEGMGRRGRLHSIEMTAYLLFNSSRYIVHLARTEPKVKDNARSNYAAAGIYGPIRESRYKHEHPALLEA
jgi:hypothetical protein